MATRYRPRRTLLVIGIAALALVPLRTLAEQTRSDFGIKPATAEEASGLWETMLTSGIGGFRAFANVAAWMRVRKAEEERQFFLLVDLYRTILRLQPRNALVREHLATELIDTISNRTTDSETAWRWVLQGMELLEDGTAANPWSHRLWSQLGHTYHRKGAEFGIPIIRRELARGDASPFARSPEWRADARQLVADYEALPTGDRARLDHAVDRIGMTLIYQSDLTVFSEYTLLSPAAQAVYRRINRMRHRLALLAYETGALHTKMEPRHRPRVARWGVLRIWDLLSLTDGERSDSDSDDDASLRTTLWHHAVTLTDAMPDESERDSFARSVMAGFVTDLRNAWQKWPPPAGAVPRATQLFGEQ